jgi:rubrerythrin
MAEFTEIVKDYFTNVEVSSSTLMDVLSEFLAVEQGGQQLYEKALELVFDNEVKTKFREFLKQTMTHQKVLTEIIQKLGGNPRRQSRTAKIADQKAQALLRTMGDPGLSREQNQLNAMENIVLAETKDHADWELLGKITRQTTDNQLREVLGPAAKTVEQEEDEHLNWTKKKLGDLQIDALRKNHKPSGSANGHGSKKHQPMRTARTKGSKSSGAGGKSRMKHKSGTATHAASNGGSRRSHK